jgi:hypothetical protein
MMVMPANNTSRLVFWWAGKYPGKIGHLVGPVSWRSRTSLPDGQPLLSYALDNGAYPAFQKGEEWNETAFLALCDSARAAEHRPLWVTVPDVVADCEATLRKWEQWAPCLRATYGWPLAFVAQDGLRTEDVPEAADVVFIGGTTEWKHNNIHRFCAAFPRVHVGRVNTQKWLWFCHESGAESCDGTGWFRGDRAQLDGLQRYLEVCAGERRREATEPFDFTEDTTGGSS